MPKEEPAPLKRMKERGDAYKKIYNEMMEAKFTNDRLVQIYLQQQLWNMLLEWYMPLPHRTVKAWEDDVLRSLKYKKLFG
jgi:hypothetical protein